MLISDVMPLQYYSIPGTSAVVPVMSLGEDLMKMSLSDAQKHADPILDATKSGRAPTLGDVKKSLKVRRHYL